MKALHVRVLGIHGVFHDGVDLLLLRVAGAGLGEDLVEVRAHLVGRMAAVHACHEGVVAGVGQSLQREDATRQVST